MVRGVREFLATRNGQVVAWAGVGLAAFALAWSLSVALRGDEAAAFARRQVFICSQTQESFIHEVKAGDTIPVRSPASGRDTGYPAEMCYWTADGRIKQKPTAVLLNGWVGRPGPTFCPDCGRLVVGRNPAPVEGRPPPTKAEWEKGGK